MHIVGERPTGDGNKVIETNRLRKIQASRDPEGTFLTRGFYFLKPRKF